jgi:hypothetical protein
MMAEIGLEDQCVFRPSHPDQAIQTKPWRSLQAAVEDDTAPDQPPLPIPRFSISLSVVKDVAATGLYLIVRSLLIRCWAFAAARVGCPLFILAQPLISRGQVSAMAKTTIPGNTRGELPTKILSADTFSIESLRKPLKMTATQKRRALKKKTRREEMRSHRMTIAAAADLITTQGE